MTGWGAALAGLRARSPRDAARALLARRRDLLRTSDVGLAYALVVVVLAVALAVQPEDVRDRLVLQSSTNLQNLRDRPLTVLVTSAFVLESTVSLWVVPVVVVVYGAAQRWLGRFATVLVAAFGHVFATLFVAVLVASGITHHQVDGSVAREADVGVSYGLAAVVALLLGRLPRRWRLGVGGAGVAYLAVLVVLRRDVTDTGHLVAWLIGLAMGAVGAAVSRAAHPAQSP